MRLRFKNAKQWARGTAVVRFCVVEINDDGEVVEPPLAAGLTYSRAEKYLKKHVTGPTGLPLAIRRRDLES